MNKDISFDIYRGYDTSDITVLYGDKKIIKLTVHNDDVMEIKAALFALQAEMQKEVVNFLLEQQKRVDEKK